MNAMTENYLPAEMRASDSDRDAVVSDLSEHFQAGRLTAGEFDERTGRALAGRTWGELRDLLADLPTIRPAPQAPAARSFSSQPRPLSGSFAPPLIALLAGIGITTVVLVDVTHGRWDFIWLLLPALLIARRLVEHRPAIATCASQTRAADDVPVRHLCTTPAGGRSRNLQTQISIRPPGSRVGRPVIAGVHKPPEAVRRPWPCCHTGGGTAPPARRCRGRAPSRCRTDGSPRRSRRR